MSKRTDAERAERIASVKRSKYFLASLDRYHRARKKSETDPDQRKRSIDGYIDDIIDAVDATEKDQREGCDRG